MKDPNPAAASNNLHHTLTYRDEQDWYDTNLGKGKGDPDIYGYPGEPEEPIECTPYEPKFF